MNLIKALKDQDYKLINGPIRNHGLLQLWLKKNFKEPELYYTSIKQAFVSDVMLKEVKNEALNVNTEIKNEYPLNIGISLLQSALKLLDVEHFDLSSKIKSGKKITISYKHTVCKEIPMGDIENYLSTADFKYANNTLLKNANGNHIIVISGVFYAKNMIAEIETDFSLNTSLTSALSKATNGKVGFDITKENTLRMVSESNNYLPIAIKADRILFNKGIFDSTTLVTGTKQLF